MSTGAFDLSFYTTDDGNIMPITVQPETLAATFGGVANAGVAGPATGNFGSVSVGQGRRTNGVNARMVRIRWDDAGEPDGYQPGGTVQIPALTPAAYAAATRGAAVAYNGGTGLVVGRSAETIR